MKKNLVFILCLLLLACLSGFLMSQPSLIGKIGIELFYKEYKFLRVWWEGALAVFGVWIILYAILSGVHRRLNPAKARVFYFLIILVAIVGFAFTYSDFQHTNTHRWLKQRFHIGAYLFWAGWILIALYFLFQPRKVLMTDETERRNLTI